MTTFSAAWFVAKLGRSPGERIAMQRRLFFTVAAALAAFIIGTDSRADIITFRDLTEFVDFTHVGSDTTITGSCSNVEKSLPDYTCLLHFRRGSQSATSGNSSFTLTEDPALQFVSDGLAVAGDFPDVGFFSLPEGDTVPCSNIGGCQAAETGLPQLAATITWSGGGTDQIFVQSDPGEPAPEPGSLALLATALGAFGLARRRALRPRAW
jgi:hypothetical protein